MTVTQCTAVSIARPAPHTLIHALRSPESRVRGGFPSPGDDYDAERMLDIHDVLAVDLASTFWVQVEGASMQEAGIDDGDFLCVDRSLAPANADVVVAVVDATMVVKTYRVSSMRWGTPRRVWLECAPPSAGQILPDEETEIVIWGVVTGVVKVMERARARSKALRSSSAGASRPSGTSRTSSGPPPTGDSLPGRVRIAPSPPSTPPPARGRSAC